MQDKIGEAKYKNLRWLKVQVPDGLIERYEILKELGSSEFADSDFSPVKAREFLGRAITKTNPEIWATGLEHMIIAPELGKKLALPIKEADANEVEFTLWLHEIGRLVDPSAYFRNDLINDRLLKEIGIPEKIRSNFFPIRTLMQVASLLNLTEDQLRGVKSFDAHQEGLATHYFNSLTPTQRIVNLADNLGKRDDEGKIFDLQEFLRYLRSQETRYTKQSLWPSVDWAIERRPHGAILQAFVIEKTIEWLRQQGIDFAGILKSLEDYGPRFIIVARHGQPDNPKNIVYNLDEVMKQGEEIHITEYGKKQLKMLGEIIKKRKFRVTSIAYSNQIRAVESSEALNQVMRVFDSAMDERLKDIYAPGAYLEGLTMDQWREQKGNAYDVNRWGEYHHESQEKLIERINNVFWEKVKTLKVCQTAILISHGDPIAWWINNQVMGKIPDPADLRSLIYPNQGQAIVAIIDPDGKWFTHYLLKDPSLIEGESY